MLSGFSLALAANIRAAPAPLFKGIPLHLLYLFNSISEWSFMSKDGVINALSGKLRSCGLNDQPLSIF